MNKIDGILSQFRSFIEEDVENYDTIPLMKETLKYNLISSGKYIRPLIFLSLLEDEGYSKYFDVALAIEMIHTYSLIHDDLPAMDDDDYRRGRLTTHKRYGEDVAILTGDALLTHAFEKVNNNKYLTSEEKVLLTLFLVEAAGINEGMINGQLLDIQNKQDLTEGELIELHRQKTGKMLGLSFKAAAALRNQNVEAYGEYGEKLGISYQIMDDYLDVYGTEKVGKTLGKDAALGKVTFASFYAKKELQELIEQRNAELLEDELLSEFSDSTQELIKNIIKREK